MTARPISPISDKFMTFGGVMIGLKSLLWTMEHPGCLAMEFYDIRVSCEPIKAPDLNFSQAAGAIIDFFGVVRAIEGDRVIEGIEYEAFQAMAERQLRVIADEARSGHDLRSVAIHHRIGFVQAGEASLFVRVSAG